LSDATPTSPAQPDFAALGLSPDLLGVLARAGHKRPTAIQAETIPVVLSGRDVEAIARTGSGKTAAYVLPLLQRLADNPAERPPATPRVLVLVPTRELAGQTADVFRQFGRPAGIRTRLAIGGITRERQIESMESGLDVLIATPGRLMDLLSASAVHLHAVAAVVLDEADRMLDEGFLDAMAEILPALPLHRQMLLFSATMPPAVAELAGQCLHKPVRIALATEEATPRQIRQRIAFTDAAGKAAIVGQIARAGQFSRIIVFVRTRATADKLAGGLRQGGLKADALHGDLPQGRRERILGGFRAGTLQVLVATDIAARGIDIADIDLVINLDMPETPQIYIHRIGRTGRGSRRGTAITLCAVEERKLLRDIERHLGMRLRVIDPALPVR